MSKIKLVVSAISYICLTGCVSTSSQNIVEQDWASVALPTNILAKGAWQLKEQNSDSFNYEGKDAGFSSKWHDNHIRGWLGPGATHFSSNHSDVIDGNLVLHATPVPAPKQGKTVNYGGFKSKKTVYAGFVTAKENIEYPVYVEANLKRFYKTFSN